MFLPVLDDDVAAGLRAPVVLRPIQEPPYGIRIQGRIFRPLPDILHEIPLLQQFIVLQTAQGGIPVAALQDIPDNISCSCQDLRPAEEKYPGEKTGRRVRDEGNDGASLLNVVLYFIKAGRDSF